MNNAGPTVYPVPTPTQPVTKPAPHPPARPVDPSPNPATEHKAEHAVVAHHFEDLAQQQEANRLGLWLFLATEVLFFGVLITGYIVFRTVYPATFRAGSAHLNVVLGTVNTAILLTSSLLVALAVHAATDLSNLWQRPAEATNKRRQVMLLLLATAALGLIFLGIKAYEYYRDFEEHLIPGFNFQWEGADARQAQLFFVLYFVTTGIHALHMIIGIAIAVIMAWLAQRHWYDRDPIPVELYGLYWHFVDIVWIFVFPFYYLIGRT
jgi:cytochrome c oxidase subunit III